MPNHDRSVDGTRTSTDILAIGKGLCCRVHPPCVIQREHLFAVLGYMGDETLFQPFAILFAFFNRRIGAGLLPAEQRRKRQLRERPNGLAQQQYVDQFELSIAGRGQALLMGATIVRRKLRYRASCGLKRPKKSVCFAQFSRVFAPKLIVSGPVNASREMELILSDDQSSLPLLTC
jgi:hypothetical protein